MTKYHSPPANFPPIAAVITTRNKNTANETSLRMIDLPANPKSHATLIQHLSPRQIKQFVLLEMIIKSNFTQWLNISVL